ncbi:hypothetical protein BSKO_09490 [Bryopsis sp. KO-2023]|nr:hypothetical protein BSKO_09490 [Bryopsis sp. KO-2023]
MSKVLWTFISFVLVANFFVEGIRDKDVIRDVKKRGFGVASCRNTKQGMWYVTDDRGTVCGLNQVDPLTGCCSEGLKHSCETCELHDKCCSTYEFCVSCCLSPDNDPAQGLASDVYRAFGHEETGHWPDEYEYCRGKCRTHKRSTVHENAYLGPRHHCFSFSARPLSNGPKLPPLPSDIQVVAGEAGENCDTACMSKQKSCRPDHFPAINSCNTLRDHFGCEATCEIDEDGDYSEPHYVTSKAPKPKRPAACFVGKNGSGGDSTKACGWKESHVRRLCACSDPEQN